MHIQFASLLSTLLTKRRSAEQVIIVGAGPSGLLLGLNLAKEGIEVLVLEAGDQLNSQPRACHYAPSSTMVMERAGVLGEIHQDGFFPEGICWRKQDGSFIAGVNRAKCLPADYRYRMVCLPQGEMIQIVYRHLEEQSTGAIRMQHRVTKVGQDASSAWVEAETPDGTLTLTADYVVGCDGANSQVRRSLFGDQEFPGRTWDQQIVATNVGASLLGEYFTRWRLICDV